ncbi:MAG: glycosyltransferase family 2 protein [Chloroflexi bacterium]|nr:glycosyltransferase family 2 protein [Chloroflexota bacterium]MCL5107743.1 glycosyltransferase family 2 protein [Chloroflexota bacterium]
MPLASVIIPNFNGSHLLPSCLDSLRRQTFRDFEVVVVDNASTDSSLQLLADIYPETRVIRLPRNLIFAGAVNEGIRSIASEMVVLLNNDTEADERWLDELALAFRQQREYAWFACKMLLFDRRNVINSAGDFYGTDGVPGNRGAWEEDTGQYDQPGEIFGACGGAAAYRRSLFADVGLFDEDLVAYLEDVDLNLRARLAGYRCYYVPTARIYHRQSATGGGPLASYLCGRNFILVAAKDLPGPLVRRYWPRLVGRQLRLLGEALSHGREPAARARIRGQLAALPALPRFLAKRRSIQQAARVSAGEILRAIS